MSDAPDPRVSVEPRGLQGSRFVIIAGGREAARLHASLWRSRARLTVRDASFSFDREPMWGRFLLKQNEAELAAAEKRSMLKSDYVITIGDTRFDFRKRGLLSMRFVLSIDDAEVGSIVPQGLLRLGATIDLPRDWPIPLQSFSFWLAWLAWKAQRSAG